jgi:hypothetical protein
MAAKDADEEIYGNQWKIIAYMTLCTGGEEGKTDLAMFIKRSSPRQVKKALLFIQSLLDQYDDLPFLDDPEVEDLAMDEVWAA